MNNNNRRFIRCPAYHILDSSSEVDLLEEFYPENDADMATMDKLIKATPRNKKHVAVVKRKLYNIEYGYEFVYKYEDRQILGLKACKIDSYYRILSYDDSYLAYIKDNMKKTEYTLVNSKEEAYVSNFVFKRENKKLVRNMVVYYNKEENGMELSTKLKMKLFNQVYVIMSRDLESFRQSLDLKLFYPMNRDWYVLEVKSVENDEVTVEYRHPLTMVDVLYFIISVWDSLKIK